MEAIERILSLIPAKSSVLDIGCGGLSGENTTNFLIKRFGEKNITGFVRETDEAKRFQEAHPDLDVIFGDFYEATLAEKYDLVVLDLNIESSIRDWEDKFEYASKFLKPRGYLLTYLMTTDQYGDPDKTPAMIREHWAKFWGQKEGGILQGDIIADKLGTLNNWEYYISLPEERRPYITWILLKQN